MPERIRLLAVVTMREGSMRVVNVHQAKTHLSRLIDEAHAAVRNPALGELLALFDALPPR